MKLGRPRKYKWKRIQVSINLPEELLELIDAFGKEYNMSRSRLVTSILCQTLEDNKEIVKKDVMESKLTKKIRKELLKKIKKVGGMK